jgi:1-acyl-sn-glycerol-3-phosphate acyltransferase
MFKKIVHALVRWMINLIARVQIIGAENIPQGGFIAVSNHIGRLDAFMVYYILQRQDIILLAAEKYQHVPLWRWIGNQLEVIWVDRFNADFKAVREVLRRLKAGGMLGVAPEGTRSKTGVLDYGKPGGVYLAARSGLQVLPVAVTGTYDPEVRARLRRLRRLDITVKFGKPFIIPQVKASDKDTLLQAYTDEVMCRIAVLLPERMWGVYAGHPRLKELLAEAPQPEPGR